MAPEKSIRCSRKECQSQNSVVKRWFSGVGPCPVLVVYLCTNCKDIQLWCEDVIKEEKLWTFGKDSFALTNRIKMMIEQANIDDAPEILSLQKLAYKSEAEIYHDDTIPPMIQTLKELQDEFEQQVFLKALVGGKIVGSVRAFSEEGTCHVGRLMVNPDFQNQGIGTKLMHEIERVFSDCKRMELFTGNKSKKNLALYQKLGYKKFKTKAINDKVTLVYLEKIL